jgi:pantothenate kinase
MKKQYRTASRGTFVLDIETNQKIAQLFERFVHPQEDELEILEKYLDSESVFLDIGANIGTIAMPMASAPGVEREIFSSSSFMSADTSAKRGVLK